MDFNFKKARNNKRKEDKARAAHHGHPGQKSHNPDQRKCQSQNQHSGAANTAKPTDQPVSSVEKNPAFSESLQVESDPTETKSYSRRSVISNWERYELPVDVADVGSEKALDFETLVNSLSDVQGHLKLSHEQSWGSERSELQEVFFNIDVHQLFASLERVPFHVRQNVPASLFTSEQLAVFEQDADEALQKSCILKVMSKEETLEQKLPVLCANELTVLTDSNTPPNSTRVPSKSETNDASTSEVIKEIPSSINVSKAKSPQSDKIPQTTPTPGESSSGVSDANSKKDELDLDFLLSLDAGVPDKPTMQQIGALQISDPNQVKAEKLDDWLDDLLDD